MQSAPKVVDIKTYIVELGTSLVDRDTWVNGASSLEIQSFRAGG
jgi:hypothetical protein